MKRSGLPFPVATPLPLLRQPIRVRRRCASYALAGCLFGVVAVPSVHAQGDSATRSRPDSELTQTSTRDSLVRLFEPNRHMSAERVSHGGQGYFATADAGRLSHTRVGFEIGATVGVGTMLVALARCKGALCGIGVVFLPVAALGGGVLGAIAGTLWPVSHNPDVSVDAGAHTPAGPGRE